MENLLYVSTHWRIKSLLVLRTTRLLKTRHPTNVGLTLGQRRRRRTNLKYALVNVSFLLFAYWAPHNMIKFCAWCDTYYAFLYMLCIVVDLYMPPLPPPLEWEYNHPRPTSSHFQWNCLYLHWTIQCIIFTPTNMFALIKYLLLPQTNQMYKMYKMNCYVWCLIFVVQWVGFWLSLSFVFAVTLFSMDCSYAKLEFLFLRTFVLCTCISRFFGFVVFFYCLFQGQYVHDSGLSLAVTYGYIL